jgi:hypothetical protein
MSVGLIVFCMPTLSLLIRRTHRAKQSGASTTNEPMFSKRTGYSSHKTHSRAYHDLEAPSRSQTRLNDEPTTINIELGDVEGIHNRREAL